MAIEEIEIKKATFSGECFWTASVQFRR